MEMENVLDEIEEDDKTYGMSLSPSDEGGWHISEAQEVLLDV